ncbi:hypothetical protein HMPREF1985_00511 [Mitsuokella sp. oral taxon 131 str. W9106]|nr:hypothetical protein HMPREF1985_00511 [Mitsuokella sp. oral taxon 131 str. W9106]
MNGSKAAFPHFTGKALSALPCACHKAHEERRKEHFGVENDADGGDSILACARIGDLIEEKRRDADGKLCDHFRAAVAKGRQKRMQREREGRKAQRASVGGKIPDADCGSDKIGNVRCKPGSKNPHPKMREKYIVQHDIREPCGERDVESLHGAAVGDVDAWKRMSRETN